MESKALAPAKLMARAKATQPTPSTSEALASE